MPRNFSARHLNQKSLRLGVKSAGTPHPFRPHATQDDCLSKIAELNPAPAKKKF